METHLICISLFIVFANFQKIRFTLNFLCESHLDVKHVGCACWLVTLHGRLVCPLTYTTLPTAVHFTFSLQRHTQMPLEQVKKKKKKRISLSFVYNQANTRVEA